MTQIQHVVAFRAKERGHIPRVVELARSLASCAGVEALVVHEDLGLHTPAFHVLLVSRHESPEALAAFRADEDHLRIARELVELTESRATVDFALDPI